MLNIFCTLAQGVVGIGSSGRFEMPAQFMPMIESGMELGDVMDKVTGTCLLFSCRFFFEFRHCGRVSE